jgi:hypothetical protein
MDIAFFQTINSVKYTLTYPGIWHSFVCNGHQGSFREPGTDQRFIFYS